jgi:hypothetical protein
MTYTAQATQAPPIPSGWLPGEVLAAAAHAASAILRVHARRRHADEKGLPQVAHMAHPSST